MILIINLFKLLQALYVYAVAYDEPLSHLVDVPLEHCHEHLLAVLVTHLEYFCGGCSGVVGCYLE